MLEKNNPGEIIRVGQGYDIHRLETGCPLILAGVHIPYEMGLAGHSDADVLLHAVIDALLGAAALGDIGEHFPDTDPAYRRIDSRVLLQRTLEMLREAGYRPGNVDVTIIAEKPRLGGYKQILRNNLSEALELKPENVNIKAKTNEGLGELGAGRAIACQAVALLTTG